MGIHTAGDRTKVEITLGDCLACSGCITSAETVLIQQQSDKQVYQVIESNKVGRALRDHWSPLSCSARTNPRFISLPRQSLPPEERKIVVVSLSLQAIASIAAKYELEFQDAAERLSTYFHSIGIEHVFDISFARHLALYESQREFIRRFREQKPGPRIEDRLCMLSSICPGFVCYVEKTHGELLTPMLSTVKSPQQVFGTLLKQIWSVNERLRPERIFHISLMPCFDKKLEASRKEFIIENANHEVDCVLTPIELESMLLQSNCALNKIQPTKLDNFLDNFGNLQKLNDKFDSRQCIRSHLGSGSGGYAENIYRMISIVIFDQQIPANSKLNFEMRRNKDYVELDLVVREKVVFRTAIINGFRNIQTLIQRIKRGSCKYDYVEVMACPSGCLNGGGLLRDVSLEIVQRIYADLSKQTLDDLEEDFIFLYAQWFDSEEKIRNYLHTTFNIIPKMKSSININW